MTVDPGVVPGLLLLAAELLTLAGVGYVVARVALRQTDDGMALAQGLVIGPALWGLLVNFMLPVLPGRSGALAGWIVILVLGIGLACRAPGALRLSPRRSVGFGAAALAVFWAALAVRQLLPLPDAIHVSLAATIQAGGSPSELPWNPGLAAPYHYGPQLLTGLLAPPVGPDLALTIEVLGAFVWMALAMIVGTALRSRGGWTSLLVLTPLLITAGAWTLIGFDVLPADIVQVPIPTGIPAAGVRASLGSVYWPEVSLDWPTWYHAPAPNIWKPQFVLGYALAFTVLEHATDCRRAGWTARAVLALLIGFLGLVEETLALTVLGCWGLLETVRFGRAWRGANISRNLALRTAAGPILAAALLAVSSGVLTDVLTGSLSGGVSLGWPRSPLDRRLVGTVQPLPGGLAMLGLGPLIIGVLAVLLGRFNRLVLSLATACGVFLLAALLLRYTYADYDLDRFDGHARNFALLALLVALSGRLTTLRPPWRAPSVAVLLVLVIWPTVAAPTRTLGLAAAQGVNLTNAPPAPRDASITHPMGQRHALSPIASLPVVNYIRDHTAARARILSPYPHHLTVATGRPNASGFAGLLHVVPELGPEYLDARRFLEPSAIRRLGFDYVHATEAWVASLPVRARRWLNDPSLFELLLRVDGDALYVVLPAFLALDPPPPPKSFEALRRAVPASATVYLPLAHDPVASVRLAAVLGHARLLGEVDTTPVHLLTTIASEPPGGRIPDVGLLPRGRLYDVDRLGFIPIWWNDAHVAYATRPGIAPPVPPPPGPAANFTLRLRHERAAADGAAFSVTFSDRAPARWTGQDWLVIEVEDTSWTLPTAYDVDGYTHLGEVWFAGQIVPGGSPAAHRYEFDARGPRLAVRGADGSYVEMESSGVGLDPGTYVLAVRLRQAYLEAAVIPVLVLRVAETGEVAYKLFAGDVSATVGTEQAARRAE
ncbi:MAG: hypothetical protein OXP73_10460 [Chloroflexota bacterium]|nr:hypothetical protein [Chloroflexota bacterium]